MKYACPCNFTKPCCDNCTCVNLFSSRGCDRCCSYGSFEQQTTAAERIVRLSELGAAVEANNFYCCEGCNKYKVLPAAVVREEKSVNVEFREICYYKVSYCSKECAASE